MDLNGKISFMKSKKRSLIVYIFLRKKHGKAGDGTGRFRTQWVFKPEGGGTFGIDRLNTYILYCSRT